MIPIVKGWCTETAQEVASIGVQVHGGMGYVEETGAAQYLRDARITTIYEGTTGIQANDLIGRKIARDGGASARAVIAEIGKVATQLDRPRGPRAASDRHVACRGRRRARERRRVGREVVGDAHPRGARRCRALPQAVGHRRRARWQLGRAALVAARKLAASDGDAAFMRAKIATARFYAATVLPQAAGLARAVTHGGEATLELAAEQF